MPSGLIAGNFRYQKDYQWNNSIVESVGRALVGDISVTGIFWTLIYWENGVESENLGDWKNDHAITYSVWRSYWRTDTGAVFFAK